MKKVAFFCIPAHGHTNPMLPVAAELVRRNHVVRFFSFDEFRDKIEATGAQFVSCDAYLPPLTARAEECEHHGNDAAGYPDHAQYGQLPGRGV